MIIKGTEQISRTIKVEIDIAEVYEALKDEVFRKLKLPSDAYLSEDMKIMIEKEWYGSHRMTSIDVVDEKPSISQIDAIKCFNNLRDVIREVQKKKDKSE